MASSVSPNSSRIAGVSLDMSNPPVDVCSEGDGDDGRDDDDESQAPHFPCPTPSFPPHSAMPHGSESWAHVVTLRRHAVGAHGDSGWGHACLHGRSSVRFDAIREGLRRAWKAERAPTPDAGAPWVGAAPTATRARGA
eukprot:6642074-Pyramimonas_sp.AAC.1